MSDIFLSGCQDPNMCKHGVHSNCCCSSDRKIPPLLLYPILHQKLKIGEISSVSFDEPDKESMRKMIEKKERKKLRMDLHEKRKRKESLQKQNENKETIYDFEENYSNTESDDNDDKDFINISLERKRNTEKEDVKVLVRTMLTERLGRVSFSVLQYIPSYQLKAKKNKLS